MFRSRLPFEARAARLFFQLVSRRYARGSLLVSVNRPADGWGDVLGDAVVASGIFDRPLHHSLLQTFRRVEPDAHPAHP